MLCPVRAPGRPWACCGVGMVGADASGVPAAAVVRVITKFVFQSHLCIVMELLGPTLASQFLVDGLSTPAPMPRPVPSRPHIRPKVLRKIAFQLVTTLAFLKTQVRGCGCEGEHTRCVCKRHVL